MHYFIFALGIALSIVAIILYLKKSKRTMVDIVLVSFTVAIVLELFTFNYATYMYYGENYKQKTFTEKSKEVTVTKGDKTEFVIHDLNTNVRDFYIKCMPTVAAYCVNVGFGDEASSKTEANAKNQVVASTEESTHYIKINPAGKVKDLSIVLSRQQDQHGSEIGNLPTSFSNIKVKVNKRIPLNLSLLRWGMVFLLMVLLLLIGRYKNVLFFGEHKHFRKIVIGIILAIQIVLVWGIQGTHEKIRLPDDILEEVNYDTQDQYHLLTLAMSKGQVKLNGLYKDKAKLKKEQNDLDKLSKLKNPYIWGQRDGLQYKWDSAFYKGNYYTYYGPVPVVLVFLPVYLLTGKMLSTRIVTMLLAILLGIIMCRFVYNIAKRRKKVGVWTIVTAMMGFFVVSHAVSCLKLGSFYDISPLMEVVFALLGINIIYEAFQKKKTSVKMLSIGALCMALSVGCKATGLLASVIIVPIVIKGLYEIGISHQSKSDKKIVRLLSKVFNKENLKYIIALAIPYIVVGVALMIYNYVRFDNPFDFGVNYQLTVYNIKYASITNIGKLPSVIYKGLLMPARLTADFPFVHAVEENSQYMGHFFVYLGSVGLVAYPIMWLIVLLPSSLRKGVKYLKDRSFVITTTVVAFVICYLVLAVGGISLRYSVEYAWLFFIPVIYVLFDLDERCKEKKVYSYFVWGIMIMLLLSTVICIGTNISPEWNSMYNKNPDVYYDMWKTFTFWR